MTATDNTIPIHENNTSEETRKTEPIKQKVQILFLKDQIESKKMEGAVSTALQVSKVKDIFKSKTEKEKIKEAKKVLLDLNDRMQHKKRLSSGEYNDETGKLNTHK